MLALLLGEGLWLGVANDSEAVAALPPGWWTPVLRLSGAVMPAGVALLVAGALVAWAHGRRGPTLAGALPDPARRSAPYLALHLAAFAATFALSRALFGGAPANAAAPGPLVGAWLAAIGLALAAWLGALFPPRALVAWTRAQAPWLVGAAVLGMGAFVAGRAARGLWLPLRRVTFAAATALLGGVVPGAFADPATLTFGTDAFAVEIAPQCAGFEGVGLNCTFLLAALWLFRDRFRFPRAFLLLAVATALALAANVARLAALVLVGTYLSPELAAGGFHSYAGSLLFCAIALGTVALGLRTSWFLRAPAAAAPAARNGDGAGAARYLVPFLAMTAAGLVSRAFSSGQAEPLYALRPLAGAATVVMLWRAHAGVRGRVSAGALGAGLLVAVAWLALGRWLPADPPAPHPGAPGLAMLIAQAASAIVLVPVVEELAFRGFLARRVASADFDAVPAAGLPWRGVVVSALAFGLLHQRVAAGVMAGLCYGAIYRWRGRLADAIAAHAATNAALVAAAWATGAWDLWR